MSQAKKRDKRTSFLDVYDYIVDSIENSDTRIFEASLIDMGNHFGIESGTMNYHVKKLEDEGYIKLIDTKGRYRRKRYVLPEDYDLLVGLGDDKEKIEDCLKRKTEKLNKRHEQTSLEIEKEPLKNEDVESKIVVEDEIPELDLDIRIQRFLEKSTKYNDANILLEQEDKDILAVINETLQQNMIYLKDLSDQLTTLETKKLVLSLIDEREALIKEMRELKESKSERKQSNKSSNLSPERVRQMQQIIISSVDSFVQLPNHAMAIERLNFRNNIIKEVKDLVDYVLEIEE